MGSVSGLSHSDVLHRGVIMREMEEASAETRDREEEGDTGGRDAGLKEVVASRIRSMFPEKEPEEVSRLASSLSHSESMRETYFGGLLQDCTAEGSNGLRVSIIWREITDREKKEKISEAFDRFSPQLKYGPFCATVKVGDIFLQWDNRNVVIPALNIHPVFASPARFIDSEQSRVLVPTANTASVCASLQDGLRVETVPNTMIFSEDVVVDMSTNARKRIDALMDTLVRYNTKFHHGILTCNCQHFVTEVLSALEAKHLVRRFEDCRKHHGKVLESRGLDVIKEEFNSHRELDTYVNIRLEDMDHSELQFCYGHYILFHTWVAECPYIEALQCKPATCHFREIRQRL